LRLQPRDLGLQVAYAQTQLLDRQQRQILPDLVFPRGLHGFVVERGHVVSPHRLRRPPNTLQRRDARGKAHAGGGRSMSDSTTLPSKMTAIAISEPGGPLVLKPEQRDLPQPGQGEILIRVRAAGVNRPDVAQRKGHYPPPPGASDLPGLEVAGEVAALGENVHRWKVGDQVTALAPGGGYAEYCRVHETNALPVPHGFTMTEAAALPETFFTVWHNVFQRGGLKA